MNEITKRITSIFQESDGSNPFTLALCQSCHKTQPQPIHGKCVYCFGQLDHYMRVIPTPVEMFQ